LGWMSFNFNAPFTYTGGGIEVAVDWDCSQVSSPAFDGDGSLKWVWESTAPVNSVAKKTASSGSPSTLSDLKDERANIQFVYATAALPCALPTGLSVSNIDTSSADVSWVASASATMNMWKVVAAGAGSMAMAVDSGATSTNMASATGLAMATSYDLYVESDCGALGLSGYAGPFNFMTTDNFGLLDNDFVTSLVISPNPSKGFATIELALTQNAEVGISVYSVTGQLVANVLSENLNQLSQRIDLSSYQDGLYFVFISINDQTIAKKIILLK
jgi:hypothetical protein